MLWFCDSQSANLEILKLWDSGILRLRDAETLRLAAAGMPWFKKGGGLVHCLFGWLLLMPLPRKRKPLTRSFCEHGRTLQDRDCVVACSLEEVLNARKKKGRRRQDQEMRKRSSTDAAEDRIKLIEDILAAKVRTYQSKGTTHATLSTSRWLGDHVKNLKGAFKIWRSAWKFQRDAFKFWTGALNF